MAETTHLNGVRGAALDRIEKSERNLAIETLSDQLAADRR
jgi:hypothetical protein